MGKRNKRKTKFVPVNLHEEDERVAGNGEVQNGPPPREGGQPQQRDNAQNQAGARDDLHICPVDPTHDMKFNKLRNHIKRCAVRLDKKLCKFCGYHAFSSTELLEEHIEICDKRPRNDFPVPVPVPVAVPVPVPAAAQPEEADATSNEAAQSDAEGFQTNENTAEPDFMRNPDFRAMLNPHPRRKKSGMRDKDKKRWETGEKRRIAALEANRQLSRSICEDCQIPNNVRNHYNSMVQPEPETPYIPVGLSSSITNDPGNNSSGRRENDRAPVESDRAFAEQSSSSRSVDKKKKKKKKKKVSGRKLEDGEGSN